FGENSSTIDHIDCIFLPFSGYRDYTSTPASRGVEAVYWTSEVSSTHAKMLYINNSTSILSVSARANGMSVRCVKE
ncbi:MAG: hypothetical protein PHV12_07600, partial [Bacteroidales bacterium]|nr:hypothetical protein [Bacteroidales bacterium]